jgi:hypothetical protein
MGRRHPNPRLGRTGEEAALLAGCWRPLAAQPQIARKAPYTGLLRHQLPHQAPHGLRRERRG